jgi:membrane protein
MLEIFKKTYLEWSGDKGPRLGAALAYYAVFSLAPILVICLSVAGLVFGQKAAQGKVMHSLQGFIGKQGASGIEILMRSAHRPSTGILAAALSVLALIAGATGVFSELKDALNTIWEVKPKSGGTVWQFIKTRLLGFEVVIGVGVLLLISALLSTALNLLEKYLGTLLPLPHLGMDAIDIALSLVVITLLFGLIFKVLPDAEISWRDVWVGSLITAVLFVVGQWLISLYIGRSASTSAYGVAGSVVILIIWLYYSAQILYFGAEFTYVYANQYGSRMIPKPGAEHAEKPSDEARV